MEAEAAAWLADRVPRETLDRLARLRNLVVAEPHNLIAPRTVAEFVSRHIVDSLQLLGLAPAAGAWVDIGSGGGFPGLAVACAREAPMTLVEPRALRAEFLARAAATLGLRHVSVIQRTAQSAVVAKPAVISARAVASLSRLFDMTHRLADRSTLWLLPKGRNFTQEVADARERWHGALELVPSVTEEGAMIVVARDVRPRRAGR